MGNSSRLFNHSCDPNLELRLVAAVGVSPVPRVVFFAKRDIAVGEELTWKYAGRPAMRAGGVQCIVVRGSTTAASQP